MTYPLVAELADAGIPVSVSCRVLKPGFTDADSRLVFSRVQ